MLMASSDMQNSSFYFVIIIFMIITPSSFPPVFVFYCYVICYKLVSIYYLIVLQVRSSGGFGWLLQLESHKVEIKMLGVLCVLCSWKNLFSCSFSLLAEFSLCDCRTRARDAENDVQAPRGDTGQGAQGGMNWEVEMDADTPVMLCIRELTNQRPLCRPGNAAQCSVVTQMGRTPSEEGVDHWFTLPHSGN